MLNIFARPGALDAVIIRASSSINCFASRVVNIPRGARRRRSSPNSAKLRGPSSGKEREYYTLYSPTESTGYFIVIPSEFRQPAGRASPPEEQLVKKCFMPRTRERKLDPRSCSFCPRVRADFLRGPRRMVSAAIKFTRLVARLCFLGRAGACFCARNSAHVARPPF